MRSLCLLGLLVWSSVARAGDADAIAKLLATQSQADSSSIFTDDAVLFVRSATISLPVDRLSSPSELADLVAPPSTAPGSEGAKDPQIAIARGGKSAWASFTVQLTINNTPSFYFRVSDALVKTDHGWRIAATAWTEPVANDRANKDAKAGKLSIDKLDVPGGDASLAAAFAKLGHDGLDATATARKELVAIGSGPGERTIGGGVLARAWKAAWVGHVATSSLVARVLPSGTTGWVVATIELDKKTYKLPFLVFCMFDKTDKGEWSLVHIHFAV